MNKNDRIIRITNKGMDYGYWNWPFWLRNSWPWRR
jgi:hypothetical protein